MLISFNSQICDASGHYYRDFWLLLWLLKPVLLTLHPAALPLNFTDFINNDNEAHLLKELTVVSFY